MISNCAVEVAIEEKPDNIPPNCKVYEPNNDQNSKIFQMIQQLHLYPG